MASGRFTRNGDRIDVARYAWPAGVAAAGAAWYAADSLRHRREGGHGYTLRGEVDVSEPSFLRAAEALTGAPVSYGNDLDLLINGDEIFPAYVEAIRQAEETVNLLTYAYWKGDIATEVADALCDRANAGVECNVLIDAVGGAQMERRLVEQMRDAGVTFCWFRPPKPYAVRRLQHRTHRKLLIVDGAIGFTGGVGIAEEWTGNAQDPDHWRDTHVRVRGPVVRGLQGAFAENWLEGTGNVLAGDRYLPDLDEVEDGGAQPQGRGAGADPGQQVQGGRHLSKAREMVFHQERTVKPQRLGFHVPLDEFPEAGATVDVGAAALGLGAAKDPESHRRPFRWGAPKWPPIPPNARQRPGEAGALLVNRTHGLLVSPAGAWPS